MTALTQNPPTRAARPKRDTDADIRALQSKEVDKNAEIFFSRLLPELLKKHRGKYALMKNGDVAGIFPDFPAAFNEGEKRYENGVYSVQRITDRHIRIGGAIRVIREK